MLSSILIIYTGGTIGMKTDPATGVLVPFDFRGIYDEFPAIRSLQVRIDVQSLTPVIDSSNVTPALWLHLAELIRDNYARYDGFVVLHGTDTMSYTASALSFLLENLAKPVVFTGSQIPIGVLRTDGRENLITAIEIAAAHDAEGPLVPEVSLYFQNRLFRANRTVKQSAEEFAAFRSYNYPALAEVGVNITFHRDYIHRPAHADAELRVAAALDDRVLVIRLFPGLREQVLRAMLSIEGLRAVVLETYGAGNAPTAPEFIRAVREAVARGLLVMNVTQCSGGRVAMELYETGRQLQEAGRHLRPRHHHRSGRRQTDVRAGAKSPRRTDAATSATRFARRIYRCRHCINRIFFLYFAQFSCQNERLTGCRPDETQDKILILRFLSGRVVM